MLNPRQTEFNIKADSSRSKTMSKPSWHFVHSEKQAATWTKGLRPIFEYRDLGIESGTGGDFVAHVIKAVGREDGDQIHQWHYHECEFQNEDIGERTLREGDCINQVPGLKHREIECSDDLEMLEIVSPADFKTVTLDDDN